MDLSEDADRICQALSDNLHRIMFVVVMPDADRPAAALAAIQTAIDQVGEEPVRQAVRGLSKPLRSKIEGVFQ